MRVVAHVRGEEPVQRLGGAAADERDEPVRDRGEERRDGPEDEPDEVGQGEQEPEEDGQARATPVVLEHEADRVRREAPGGADLVRVGVRVAVGEEQDVGVRLRGVADP